MPPNVSNSTESKVKIFLLDLESVKIIVSTLGLAREAIRRKDCWKELDNKIVKLQRQLHILINEDIQLNVSPLRMAILSEIAKIRRRGRK